MSQYAWICLNNAEYDWICRHIPEKKQNAEHARTMNVSDAVAQDHYTNYWAVTETETRSEHSQTFKMECFAKGKMPECRCKTKNFPGQGRSGFVELGHFDKHFVNRKSKRDPAGKHFGSFSPKYL